MHDEYCSVDILYLQRLQDRYRSQEIEEKSLLQLLREGESYNLIDTEERRFQYSSRNLLELGKGVFFPYY